MLNFRKVLAPVDMSDFSLRVLEDTVAFASRCGASVTILTVIAENPYSHAYVNMIDISQITRGIREHAELKLKEIAETFADSGVPVDTDVTEGNPYIGITDFAREGDYDLIVMGSHGYSGIDHILLGSVTEKVVRKAHCPVLTVRMKPEQND